MKAPRLVKTAALVVAAGIALTAGTANPSEPTAAMLADLLPELGSCEYDCFECGNNHTLLTSPTEATKEGFHTEWCDAGDCGTHPDCGGGGVSMLREFESLYYAATVETIMKFVTSHPERVSLNARRSAIQLMGCTGQVLASYPLPTAVAD